MLLLFFQVPQLMILWDLCLMPKLMYFWFAIKSQTPQHCIMSRISGCLKFANIGTMPLLFYVDVKMTSGAIPRSYPASVRYKIFIIESVHIYKNKLGFLILCNFTYPLFQFFWIIINGITNSISAIILCPIQ